MTSYKIIKMNNPCEHSDCHKSSIKGFSTGIAYGAKVRFTHSIVISMLFGKGNLQKRLKQIFKNTFEHSKNLGLYVFCYKTVLCLISKYFNKKSPINSAISGVVSSYFISSKETPVNSQINLYLFSRILMATTRLLYQDKIIPPMVFLAKNSFKILAVFCWASVMYLFEKDKGCLQSSLVSSMDYLYKDSEKWSQIIDFIPFGESLQNYVGRIKF